MSRTASQVRVVSYRREDLVMAVTVRTCPQQFACCGEYEVPRLHHQMIHIGNVQPMVNQSFLYVFSLTVFCPGQTVRTDSSYMLRKLCTAILVPW